METAQRRFVMISDFAGTAAVFNRGANKHFSTPRIIFIFHFIFFEDVHGGTCTRVSVDLFNYLGDPVAS
jgi:hypothetical protein